jgi:hypothetical protein
VVEVECSKSSCPGSQICFCDYTVAHDGKCVGWGTYGLWLNVSNIFDMSMYFGRSFSILYLPLEKIRNPL